jgi:protease I
VNNQSVIIFLAKENFNEVEFQTVNTVLKNAGIKIYVASDSFAFCRGNNSLKIKNDVNLFNINAKNFKAFILIGGDGINEYLENKFLHSVIHKFNSEEKIISAICYAPIIIAKAGLLRGKKATCYIEVKNELIKLGVDYIGNPIICDENIITANGPEASSRFAETIIKKISEMI